MGGEDRVDHRPEPRDPPARIARGNGDAKRDVGIELNCRHEKKIGSMGQADNRCVGPRR